MARESPGPVMKIALAGNPNVGKSTVFNALTGLHQHTGNWSGKTVVTACGTYTYKGDIYLVTDIPGASSLTATSADEAAARDYICFGGADVVVSVCDATSLQRGLNLTLQILEITPHVILAVNMMDEARKRGIAIDLKRLSRLLGIPVVGMSARGGRGLEELRRAIAGSGTASGPVRRVRYSSQLEAAAAPLEECLNENLTGGPGGRWTSLRLLSCGGDELEELLSTLPVPPEALPGIRRLVQDGRAALRLRGLAGPALDDELVSSAYRTAEDICREAVSSGGSRYGGGQLRADRLLTRRLTGIPVMLLLLGIIFFITIKGANGPSDLLYSAFDSLGSLMSRGLVSIGAPGWLRDVLIDGVWRVMSWVVSVMLPPMAIFFPFFTLLEDLGYLPRVAFNLDSSFRRAGACGKQGLTMCMGFGCNAAGVVGCRIIDSPRERLIAVLTNSLVPCNGRFPILISLISMFFIGLSGGFAGSLGAAAMLTGFILLGVAATLLSSRLLSRTLLRGVPSTMVLELPPFRRPQVGQILVRSLLDRTIFVLARAAAVAAPAGLIIWLTANVTVDGETLLHIITGALDGPGRFLGMDGVILTAFILGLPANETVMPIIIMAYAAQGGITSLPELADLRRLLVENGWTVTTALCTAIFTIMHWPCSTTIITIKKETGSLKWAAMAVLLPTAAGCLSCAAVSLISKLFT